MIDVRAAALELPASPRARGAGCDGSRRWSTRRGCGRGRALGSTAADYGYELTLAEPAPDEIEATVRAAVTSYPDPLFVLAGDGTARLATGLDVRSAEAAFRLAFNGFAGDWRRDPGVTVETCSRGWAKAGRPIYGRLPPVGRPLGPQSPNERQNAA